MGTIKLQQKSVLGGISPTYYDAPEGSYLAGLGVDPDLSAGVYRAAGTAVRTSGAITPVGYTKFSGANVATSPIAIITSPKKDLMYVVTSDGKLISYSTIFASETVLGTVSGGLAYGAWYYNNYIYIATATDVSRWGPLNGSAALVDNVWTGATLGSKAATTNTTYPTIRQLPIPQHWGAVHVDGASYFCDFVAGQGVIHKIKTKKVTNEGDTDDGSAYNVLDLPFGYYPTSVQSFGNDLAITAIQTTDSTFRQGNAALFLWDTISDSFYRQIPLPDVYATAMFNANGRLYVFTGSAFGSRLSYFTGGNELVQVLFFEDGVSPLAGAVDAYGDKIVFGATSSYPSTCAVVVSFGSKDSRIPTVYHTPIKASSGGGTPVVTAVRFVQQVSGVVPRCIVGWKDNSTQGLDKYGTDATNQPVWRSRMFQIGKKFKIKRLSIPLGDTTSAGAREITVKIYVDDETTAFTLTNQTDGKRVLLYKRPELTAWGMNNFFLQLEWNYSTALPVELPIEFEVEVFSDQITS